MGTQREVREGTNPDELLVDEGFNAILVGIIQKKFGLVSTASTALGDGGISHLRRVVCFASDDREFIRRVLFGPKRTNIA